MAKGIGSAWQRSVSRQRTSNPIRGGNPPTQTRAGESTTGARYPKKSSEHLFAGIQMKYQFIEQQKQEFPVVVMCRVLNVSESGFYAWRKRPICQRQREDAQLSTQIRQVFTSHQGSYGSPPLHPELTDPGSHLSPKRVARLVRAAGPCAKGKR